MGSIAFLALNSKIGGLTRGIITSNSSVYSQKLFQGLELLQIHQYLTVFRLSPLYSKWQVSFTFRNLYHLCRDRICEGLAVILGSDGEKCRHNLNQVVQVGCTRRDNLGHN